MDLHVWPLSFSNYALILRWWASCWTMDMAVIAREQSLS